MFHKKIKNHSGAILLSVLWMVMILAAFAATLSRQAGMDMAMTKHTIGRLQSKYQAWAGIVYAIKRIQIDSNDPKTKGFDSLYSCGVAFDDEENLKSAFEKISEDKNYFQIGTASSKQPFAFGMQDEDRLMNINAITRDNQKAFIYLLELLDIGASEAETIVSLIMDWKDEDDIAVAGNHQKEEEYYQSKSLSYAMKNRPFDALEELRLLGVSEDDFQKISPYLTVHPANGSLRINFDTATGEILKALAHTVVGFDQGSGADDADSLVAKMLEFRRGDDGQDKTADDRLVEFNDMPLNAQEKVLAMMLNQYRTKQSDYLRIVSQGFAVRYNVKVTLEAVVRRKDLAIVEWKRN
jgi:type II secretory pathway component PulK